MRGEDVGGAVQRPVRPVRQRLEEGIQRRNLLRRLRIRDPSRNLKHKTSSVQLPIYTEIYTETNLRRLEHFPECTLERGGRVAL